MDRTEIGLLVVGHGSRRREANDTLRTVAASLAERGRWRAVQPAYLELVRPTIREGYAALVVAGCAHIVVHPYFLFPGNHTMADIPAELAAAHADHARVDWTITAPLGLHPLLLDVVDERVAETLAGCTAPTDALTGSTAAGDAG